MHHESLAAAATEKSLAAAQAEHELQLLQMQLAADRLREELEQVCSFVRMVKSRQTAAGAGAGLCSLLV